MDGYVEIDLDEYAEETENAGEKRFAIANDDMAEWAVQKIAAETAEAKRLIELAKAQIDKHKAQIDKLTERQERRTSFLTACLNEYFASVPHKETKTMEKYELLSGTLVLKKGKLKPVPVTDDLLNWLKQNKHDQYIKTTEEPLWEEFKKVCEVTETGVILKETGEIVDGVITEAEPAKFVIDIKKEDM